jgi:hypothetical protein
MKIKQIKNFECIRDLDNDNIDVFVETEDDYSYIVTVATVDNLLEEIFDECEFYLQDGELYVKNSEVDFKNDIKKIWNKKS